MAAMFVSVPQHVIAEQWTGFTEAIVAVLELAPGKVRISLEFDGEALTCELLAGKNGAQGWVPVPIGHWLVHAPSDVSDVWPVEEAYFKAKYELAGVRP